jgi:uncharacterized protein (TIGR02145 family)
MKTTLRVQGQGFRVSGPGLRVCAAILFFTTVATFSLIAQSLSVFNVDATNFPNMKAKFYAFDVAGNRITVNSTSAVTVLEDGVARTVTLVSCPISPPPPTAISSVLTIDVSGSMSGSGIQTAKAAAKAWINALNLPQSECALTTFNGSAYLNKDFSTDATAKADLLKAVNALSADGMTDYDNAFLNPPAGSLHVMKSASRKTKVIVFLSDGQSNNSSQQTAIIAEAQKQSVAIYVVILGMTASQEVKDLCEKTKGQWFENVTTEQQAADIYSQILQTAQGGTPCDLEWISDGCGQSPKLVVSLPAYGPRDTLTYSVPLSALPKIAYTPSLALKFGQVDPGSKKSLTVTLKAQGMTVRVDSVKRSDSRFRITDYSGAAPPFTLGVGQSRTLTVEFAPTDSSYAFCMFTVIGDACLVNTSYADGGWRGKFTPHVKIKVLRPNGGERFVAGSDEVLTWEGVMPEEKVKLEYRTGATASWNLITDTSGLRYVWRVPKRPSDTCLLRATAQVRSLDGTVTICTQIWMDRNLDVETYRNGDLIPEVKDPTQWAKLTTGAWCYYNNDPAIGAEYGKLYNFYAVIDPRGLAPIGWHVPTDADWKKLEMCLGMTQSEADASDKYRGTDQGGQLKEAGLTHWSTPNTGATNSSGFTAFPGGIRWGDNSTFDLIGDVGSWWSSLGWAQDMGSRSLSSYLTAVGRWGEFWTSGLSVRCVRD